MALTMQEQAAKKPCGCGCTAHEETCCGLDRLTKPRFFCGQLLTDQDMTALVAWTQNKLGLSRFRHGWGVVCGLDVRCDRTYPASVMVTPGYAVGCCGEGLVGCNGYTVERSRQLTPPNDTFAPFIPAACRPCT